MADRRRLPSSTPCVVAVLVLLAACSADGSGSPRTAVASTPPPTRTAVATTPAPTPPNTPAPTTTLTEEKPELRWWNDRVFYEIFVRSFKDSDGDGIGDLRGLTASLDYLNDGEPATTDDLGVTGIWLMPIFPSPSYHGYDVTDYRSVNPDYGTLQDFEAFLDAAHERGIAVLIDLVINHTSVEHPWFTASAAGDPEYRGWYRWSPTDPGTTAPWGAKAWHESGGQYYFGLFWEGMPDLNLENAEVTAELYDIAHFWLEDVGVDGFRLDAARHLIEQGDVVTDTPETIGWLEEFNAYVDSIAPDALVLGEVWSPTEVVARYVPKALDLAFEFALSESGGAALAAREASVFGQSLAVVLKSYPQLQWATFLTNHDMDRIMSAAGGDVRIAKLAATWLLTSPGVPFIYYGEEVGLQGAKPDERIRTPMPWNGADERVGFTTGTPWESVDPGYPGANVAGETDDPDSLLSHYRTLIHDRAASAALRRGDTMLVDAASPSVMAFVRSDGDDHVLVVLNLSPEAVFDTTLDLVSGPLAGVAGAVPVVGPPAWAPEIDADGGFTAYRPLESLPPYGFLVLRLTDQPSAPPSATSAPTTTILPPAGADEVAVVEQMIGSMLAGDIDAAIGHFSPDAVWSYPDGSQIPLDEPLPPEAGLSSSTDWNGDGTLTLRDVLIGQNAFGSLILTSYEHQCTPVGPRVVCDITQTDVFGDLAGLPPSHGRQTFRVADGQVVELSVGEPSHTEAEGAAWLEQFVAYEQWLAYTDPDSYDDVFTGECCSGTPETMRFTPASIELQRVLIPRWRATLPG